MRLRILENGAWEISRMHDMELHLLSGVATAADPSGSDAARARLYPERATLDGEGDGGADQAQDWKEFVVPELESGFADALTVVRSDLSTVEREIDEDEEDCYRVDIPREHADSWYSALNQARLVLSAKYELPASEEDFLEQPTAIDERWLACAQSHIYAVIQTFLLDHVMRA